MNGSKPTGMSCTMAIIALHLLTAPALRAQAGEDSTDANMTHWGEFQETDDPTDPSFGMANPGLALPPPPNDSIVRVELPVHEGPLTGMRFVEVPAGSFMMGSLPWEEEQYPRFETPRHEVTFEEPFQIMNTEVTQQMWTEVMGTTVHDMMLAHRGDTLPVGCNYIQHGCTCGSPDIMILGEGPDYPMYYVDYQDCLDFVDSLNAIDSHYVYSLPSEAQWEYACKAGYDHQYQVGNFHEDLLRVAWILENCDFSTQPVAQLEPNAWGLHDMLGNVLEWCADTWHEDYEGAPTDGSAWMDGGYPWHVRRGGCWRGHHGGCRASARVWRKQRLTGNWLGFRLVRTPVASEAE